MRTLYPSGERERELSAAKKAKYCQVSVVRDSWPQHFYAWLWKNSWNQGSGSLSSLKLRLGSILTFCGGWGAEVLVTDTSTRHKLRALQSFLGERSAEGQTTSHAWRIPELADNCSWVIVYWAKNNLGTPRQTPWLGTARAAFARKHSKQHAQGQGWVTCRA